MYIICIQYTSFIDFGFPLGSCLQESRSYFLMFPYVPILTDSFAPLFSAHNALHLIFPVHVLEGVFESFHLMINVQGYHWSTRRWGTQNEISIGPA